MANQPKAFTDVHGVSRPATALIKLLRTSLEPWFIRRRADANAYAKHVEITAEIEADELRECARERYENRELRRQLNMRRITEFAFSNLDRLEFDADANASTEAPNPVDSDWLYKFWNYCQDIGNAEMQSLWGQILAGEATKPGTFSFRTLNVVSLLSRDDADLFTQYCGFIWELEGGRLAGLRSLFDSSSTMKDGSPIRGRLSLRQCMEDCGVHILAEQHLENCGLLNVSGLDSAGPMEYTTEPFRVSFGGVVYRFESQPYLSRIDTLTDVGTQLYPICGAKPNIEYRDLFIEINSGVPES